MKLNQEVNVLIDENKGLKKKVCELEDDTTNYKTIMFSKS
jgi:hypothetical protein